MGRPQITSENIGPILKQAFKNDPTILTDFLKENADDLIAIFLGGGGGGGGLGGAPGDSGGDGGFFGGPNIFEGQGFHPA